MSSYATPADLQAMSLPAAALTGIDAGTQQAALDNAAGEIDSYIASQYVLPLIAPFPRDLVQRTCDIAAYRLLKTRGFNPEDAQNKNIIDDFDKAIAWAKSVGNGTINLQVTDSSTPATQTPIIRSNPNRGWNCR